MNRKLMKQVTALLLAFCSACAGAIFADDPAPQVAKPEKEILAGHSSHGEVFNEGPRQKAYLMDGMGKVSFPVTTKVPLAQDFVNQGVAQLHGFWYFEAERSFRQAAALDPDCAMAYWGMSRANIENENRGKPLIAEAVKRKAGVTPREAMYIDAMDAYLKADSKDNKQRSQAYATALENIILKFPEDIEAKAFLGLQLWTNEGRGVALASRLAVDALLRQVIDVSPLHPCHHYRIHLWDAGRAEQALDSSALCGQGSPGIAHMWHMPGHIYSKLHRYSDAAWQQEASARVDHAHMIRDRVLPDQIHNFAHNNEWLIRDLMHVGRVRDAVDLARNMVELPRHPKYNTASRGSSHYGRMRLFQVLSDYELWSELIQLCDTPYLEPTDNAAEQVRRLQHIGKARFRGGEAEKGHAMLVELEDRLVRQRAAQNDAGNAAEAKAKQENKDEKQVTQAKDGARNGFSEELKSLETAVTELLGHLAVSNSDFQTGLALLKSAGSEERYLVQIQLQAGEGDQAEQAAQKIVTQHQGEVLPQLHLVSVLWQRDKKKEAGEAFQKLRENFGMLDLSVPPATRLAPIAKELGFPDDWRIVGPPPQDIGIRPSLDSLGPFRWHPAPAFDWALKDAEGKEVSSQQYRGKPVVLIFYLGFGCLHCAQQLQAFAPKTKDFADAGISLVAISTDDQSGLQKSIENYKEGLFPFPLLSDSGLSAFKPFRAFDDFENVPMHATFVIDGSGLVRWQDISFEPFMNPDFVLQEAKRQLAQSALKTAGDGSQAARR